MRIFLAILFGCIASSCGAQTPCALPCLITGTDGPQGPIGPAGPQGVAGPQGPAGPGGVSIMPPRGRLTLVPGTPEMTADVTSPSVWYAPYGGGDSFPVLDGTLTWQSVRYTASAMDQVGAVLTGGAKWTAGSSRDIFGTSTGAICSGPAWPASDRIARLLIKYNGIDINSAALTCDTSATTSVPCPQYQCTYLGSINSSVSGQLTAQFSYGQNRKFEIWTAYAWNQIGIALHVGFIIPTIVPTNQYPAWVPFNNDALNRANVFTGMPTLVDVVYHQNSFVNSGSGPAGTIAVVGWNGMSVGHATVNSSDTSTVAGSVGGVAEYVNPAAVGLNTATMFVAKANAATSTLFGGVASAGFSPEANSVLFAKYKG